MMSNVEGSRKLLSLRVAAAAHPSGCFVSGRGKVSEQGQASHHRIEELSTMSQIGEAGAGGWENAKRPAKGPCARLSPSKMGRKGKIGKIKKSAMRLILLSLTGHRQCGKFCSHCRMSE